MLKRLVVLVVLVACSGITESARDPHCFYPGDTIARLDLRDANTGQIVRCWWVVSTKLDCAAELAFVSSQATTPACPAGSDQ